MAETDSYFQLLRTSSVSSASLATHDSISTPASSRSTSPVTGWKIQYKTMHEPGSKGVWDGYQSREEFMVMHLR